MNKHEIDDILTIFAEERFVFPYFKDRYALMLLADYVGDGMAVQTIKQSHLRGLLHKPRVKDVIKQCGNGRLNAFQLATSWPHRPLHFVLTLGQWGNPKMQYQTSRRGLNLVVQLNFSNFEDRAYERLIRPKKEAHKPFQMWGHPISQSRNTLAWSRIDLDLNTGEALIEEVQSDWVRKVRWQHDRLKKIENNEARRDWLESWCEGDVEKVEDYFSLITKFHAKIWDEAMLMATIWFLREHVGIGRIFYHTWEGGLLLKDISSRWSAPPRSLYTKLPRRFCFQRTEEQPYHIASAIHKRRKVRKAVQNQPLNFYLLE